MLRHLPLTTVLRSAASAPRIIISTTVSSRQARFLSISPLLRSSQAHPSIVSPSPTMRAYYYDDLPGDARSPHEAASPSLSESTLSSLGVSSWHIPVPSTSTTEEQLANAALDPISSERSYKHRDVITISPRHMGDAYEGKIKMFFEEHMHEDEEARYCLDGSGYFDVRDRSDARWIRIRIERGDLIVLPAGVYHRFTPDDGDYIQAMRLFKDEPKWTPLNRGESTEANKHRIDYVEQRQGGFQAVHAAA